MDAEGSRRVHGHTYYAEITLAGTPDAQGMVANLGFVRKGDRAVRDLLDHRFLDEVAGLGPATLEKFCCFIFVELADFLPALIKVSVERQASDNCCYLSK